MNFIRKIPFLLALALSVPVVGFSQYSFKVDPLLSYFHDAGRYELGGGIINPTAEFTGVVHVLDANKNYKGDSTAKRTITASGYGAQIGLNLPFKATGHISCWALALQLQVNQYIWQDLNQTMTTTGQYKAGSTSLNSSTMQIALPIGIDYKVGNDAIKSKRLAFGASMGAGVIPQFNNTALEGVSSSAYNNTYGWGVTPYAKFDWSIFAGLCWKLRFMYTMGRVNIQDVNAKVLPLNDGPFTLSTKSAFMASLIIMPFSGGWEESAWYNTYDTYNNFDRFN